mgnify:CR=1 FL=1
MKAITSVAFEWSADDIRRAINNLSSDEQVIVESRIDNQHEFMQKIIDDNDIAIIGFINDLITNAINNEY